MMTRTRHLRSLLAVTLTGLATGLFSGTIVADEPKDKVMHSFLAAGNETFLVDGAGKVTWKYAHSTRDGWVLSNGNILLALSKSKDYPGGAAIEVTREGKTVFEFKGTQAEVNT